jgi:hypothetical protein
VEILRPIAVAILAGALLMFAWAVPTQTPSQPCVRSCQHLADYDY